MRLKRIGSSAVAVLLIFCGFGIAGAQTSENPPPSVPTPMAQTARDLELPPEQQLALGRQYMMRMDQSASAVKTMLEAARAARDVVKTLCLNDKLNQIDVAGRTARDRLTSLQGAVEAKDRDRARHEFTILQVLRDRVDQLIKEANQCIGEEAGFIGESQVTVDISKNIPNNNPDQLGFDPDVANQPPVVSSQTM